jgi:hypothetical protein
VLAGAVGVWLGYPLADPIVGLLIAAAILVIVWQSGKAVFTRMLDGVEPEVVEEIRHAACEVDGVQDVSEVRARWLGHRLHAEVNIAVNPDLSVAEGHIMLVLLAALYWAILHQRGLRFAPLCVARGRRWCDHDYPRWGGYTLANPPCSAHWIYHRVGALTGPPLGAPTLRFALRPHTAMPACADLCR